MVISPPVSTTPSTARLALEGHTPICWTAQSNIYESWGVLGFKLLVICLITVICVI